MKSIILVFMLLLAGCITHYSYGVYQVDNRDDKPSEGIYRITDDQGRVGYANETLSVIIFPQYAYGFPFSGGKAKVTYSGKKKAVQGEISDWQSEDWFYIDRYGNRLEE